VACVGLWTDISVRLLRLLPGGGIEEISRDYLGGEIIPRSVLLAKFERINYLLCALGDGTLFYYVLAANGSLTDKKKVSSHKSRGQVSGKLIRIIESVEVTDN
jgi:DNA damage-binding protein 1